MAINIPEQFVEIVVQLNPNQPFPSLGELAGSLARPTLVSDRTDGTRMVEICVARTLSNLQPQLAHRADIDHPAPNIRETFDIEDERLVIKLDATRTVQMASEPYPGIPIDTLEAAVANKQAMLQKWLEEIEANGHRVEFKNAA